MKIYDRCLFLYNPMSGKEDIVNNLDYIVIEKGSAGFLGIGFKQAVIKARRKVQEPEVEEVVFKEEPVKSESVKAESVENSKAVKSEKSSKPAKREKNDKHKKHDKHVKKEKTAAKEISILDDLIEMQGSAAVIPAEAVQGRFPEFAGCQFLQAMYSTVHIMEDKNTVNNSHPAFQVYAGYHYDVGEITPELLLFGSSSFRMNLETGEMESVDFEPFVLDGKEAALWVSDERLKQLIYTLMDILPPPEK